MGIFLKFFFKTFFLFLAVIISLVLGFLIYINFPVSAVNNDAKLGVTFSLRYAQDIGLEWKETFIAILDGLEARKIRIPVYWDLAEKEEGIYDFSDIDWQLNEAQKRDVEIILVVGQKVPRWPECFIPEWAKNDEQKKKRALLKFIDVVVSRYKKNSAVKYWQVENEPFLNFGICPPLDANLLDAELAMVKLKDNTRKVIVTDSGELSLWIRAAKRADIFGTTMYRTIWNQKVGYYNYPIGPRFFQFKYWLNKVFAKQNNAIVVELQAEPWINGWTTSSALSEQFKSMDAPRLKDNVEFAKKVGFPEIYLWGVEWWYWLKEKQGHPELWDTAKDLFNGKSVL